MITLLDYISYFKNIAAKNRNINGFLKLGTKDLGEATNSIRSADFKAGDNILLLENFEIKQHVANRDQVYDVATGLFSIFQSYNPRGTFDIDSIAEQTLAICRQVERRMLYDENRNKGFWGQLQTGSFEFEPCHAPILNMFGWRVFFDFADVFSLEYDENEWN